jgi:hypothetical protein
MQTERAKLGEERCGRHAPRMRGKWLKSALLPALVAAGMGVSGCSVFMAVEQPKKRDLSVLTAGTKRSEIIAEFGLPVTSRLVGLNRVDLFTFTQGYSKEVKVGRAVAHGTMDLATAGVWEIAGTPTEAVFSGKKLSYEVTYDRSDRVQRVVRLGE